MGTPSAFDEEPVSRNSTEILTDLRVLRGRIDLDLGRKRYSRGKPGMRCMSGLSWD